jgi:hypothetical protein
MSTQYIDDSMLIISQLINNKNYFKRIISHLQPEYFDFDLDKRIFKFIQNYSAKYDSAPGNQILKNALSKLDLVDPEHEQYINEFLELVDEGHTGNRRIPASFGRTRKGLRHQRHID